MVVKYESVRHPGTFMTTDGVVDEKTKTVFIKLADGKEQNISVSTLKRWWRKVSEVTSQDVDVKIERTEVNDPEIPQHSGFDVEPIGSVLPKKNTTKKTSKKSVKPDSKTPEILDYIYSKVEELGGEVFVPSKDIKMRSFKVGGHMFMAVNYSGKSVTIKCRSKVVTDTVGAPTKTVNHMFDALYVITELTEVTQYTIDQLIKVSMDYQIQKNTKKTAKNKEEN